MPFKRDSVAVLLDRIYANYSSLFKPLDKTPRHNLLKVFAAVDAGILHQNLGDLDFLALQLFPDTAQGDYLRQHWSGRVTPLYAIASSGQALVTGIYNRPVPADIVFASIPGERYYTERAYKIGEDGTIAITLKSQNTGINTNLSAGEELSIVSSIPAGIEAKAVVIGDGIIGGADAESDEEYLSRVLLWLRNPVRYGKQGHFAAWARDASPEVTLAWEYKNFGVFGALLIQVISGNQLTGIFPVDNIKEVTSYINEVAPPIIFTVRTPEIVQLNPTVSLPLLEDTQTNREIALNRMKAFLQLVSMPGVQITAGALRGAIIDGVSITAATVKLGGDAAGIVKTTILQYPYIGDVSWE